MQYDQYNTAAVRRKLGISLRLRNRYPAGSDDQDQHQEIEVYRVLRLITTEHLEPLQKLKGWNFIDAWFQCAEAHYLNWKNGIHHQDPSLNNLMYRNRDGKNCPVLNDWDLAVDASASRTHTGLEMTGTMQFMALARLQSGAWGGYRVREAEAQLQHLYRHDLEAFFYILAWVVCCYKDGQRLNPLPPLFETWAKGDTNECYNSKYRFIHDQRWPQDSLPTDSWSGAMVALAEDHEMVAFADIIRLFFTIMLRKLAGSPESWMQSRFDNIMARAGGRALPPSGRALPPPEEDDKPTEIWEDFCGAVKEGLLILSDRMNLKKEDLPPRLASFLPDSQMDMPL
ncbi:hypothetical protein GGG16DRAFT_49151 [Schizophyllum commune]